MSTPSVFQLTQALRIQEQIEKLQAELRSLLSGDALAAGDVAGNGGIPAAASRAKKKSGMSVEGRARIAAAQKARWAKLKVGTEASKAAVASAPKKRRKMSPEARARIVAAVRARWAKVKASKK
jgi:hypothetical protein